MLFLTSTRELKLQSNDIDHAGRDSLIGTSWYYGLFLRTVVSGVLGTTGSSRLLIPHFFIVGNRHQ